MSALGNLKKGTIPTRILLDYLKLYREIGKGENIIDFLDENSIKYKELSNTVDSRYLFLMFNKEHKISDTRFNSIIECKPIEPKTTDEILLKNIRNIITICNQGKPLIVDSSEINDLSTKLYKNIPSLKNEFKKSNKDEKSYRDRLDLITEEYKHVTKENESEYIYKCLSFLVDFLKLSPFKHGNEMIGIILFYSMMLDSDIKSLKYTSFFKKLYDNYDEYNESVKRAFYLYEDGYSDCFKLHKLMMNILIESYDDLNALYRNIFFDKQLSKANSIESAIYKLPEMFSKDDVRKSCPTVSLSTIDRTLAKMQEDGKITAYGRGRGSKWVRLDHTYDNDELKLD